MTTIVVNEDEGSPSQLPMLAGPEAIDENGAVIEAAPEAAVAVAQIEAERDITIAAIHAETEQAHIEAETERREVEAEIYSEARQADGDYEWLRDRVENLTEQVAALTAQLLTPQLSLEEMQPEEVEIVAPEEVTISTQPFTLGGTSETQMEATPESADEKEAAQAPAQLPLRKVRLI